MISDLEYQMFIAEVIDAHRNQRNDDFREILVEIRLGQQADQKAADAERNGVDIRTHRIIYEIIEEVEAAMKGMLAPKLKAKKAKKAKNTKNFHFLLNS